MIAWALAAGLDFTRRLFEPACGPLAVFVLPVWAVQCSIPTLIICLLLGLPLRIPKLVIWCSRLTPLVWGICICSLVTYWFGVYLASHAYFELKLDWVESQKYVLLYSYPAYYLIVFLVANWPQILLFKKPNHPVQPTSLRSSADR